MANALEGTARFTFAGCDYLLVLDNRVWIEAEDVLGYSVLDAVEELRAALNQGRNPRLKTMCAIVYGGLKANHPDITEDAVLEMFFSEDQAFRAAVMEAMRGAQMPSSAPIGGDAGGQGGKARTAKAAGTGS